MHGVWRDCQISLKGSVIPFTSVLSLTSVRAAALGHPWPPLACGSPLLLHSVCYISGGRAGQGQGGLKYSLMSPYSSPSFASWILFDEKNFEGEQRILSEGEFPTHSHGLPGLHSPRPS